MYELKTKISDRSVLDYLNGVNDINRKTDAFKLLDIIKEVYDESPKMWGDSIIGYGSTTYTNSQNKVYDWFLFGFSPRKKAITLYLTAYSEHIYHLADQAGLKHGKGCIYIKSMEKTDVSIIKEMIEYTIKKN